MSTRLGRMGRSCTALAILLVWSGCSALNFNTTLVVEDMPQDATLERDSSLDEDGVNWRETVPGGVELSNHEPYHLLRWSQPGHYPEVHPLFPTERNPLKWLDGAAMVGGAWLMGKGIEHEANGTGPEEPAVLIGTGFFTAFFAGLGLILPPKRVYPNALQSPRLTPMPARQINDPWVEVHAVDLAIQSGQYTWRNYRDLEAFDARKAYHQGRLDEAVILDDSNLDAEVLEVLEELEWSLQDEVTRAPWDEDDNETLGLHGRLTHVCEHRVGSLIRYEATSLWAIHNPYNMVTDTLSVSSWSTWSGYVVGGGLRRDLISEALRFAATKAVGSQEDAWPWRANRDVDFESAWKATWDSLHIEPGAPHDKPKVSSALPSVVTVLGESSFGSGCVLDAAGWIVTNHHVVEDTTDAWTVKFHDGTEREAEVVRWDPVRDLALIHVDTLGLTPLPWSTSLPDIGDEVYAIGTPLRTTLDATVTRGILSAKRGGKTYQTDVSISPGNSGGPLLNDRGEWIGVVNAKVVAEGVEGIGFAIPLGELTPGLGVHR